MIPVTTLLSLLLSCSTPRHAGPWTAERAMSPALSRLDTDKSGTVDAAEWARVEFHSPTFTEADANGDGTVSVAELLRVNQATDPTLFYDPKVDTSALDLLAALPNAAEVYKRLEPPAEPQGPQQAGGRPGGPGPGGRGPEPGVQGPGGRGPGPGGQGGQHGAGRPAGPGGPGGAGGPRLHGLDGWMVMAILKEEVRFVDPDATLPSDDAISAVGHRYALKSPEARAVLDPILAAADKANVLVPAALREAQASPEAAPEKPVSR